MKISIIKFTDKFEGLEPIAIEGWNDESTQKKVNERLQAVHDKFFEATYGAGEFVVTEVEPSSDLRILRFKNGHSNMPVGIIYLKELL